ncbi:MAG: protein phosphatase 2C domain-containing protein [Oscillospiraceae bacterium]|nr:protein phosphatase 2C domain-containing protein [Oscillospiraceae bacterium]
MGRVRGNNEDNLYCAGVALTPETRDAPFALAGDVAAPCVFAVCDGMGGQEDGEFASLAAVSALAELESALKTMPPEELDAAVQNYVSGVNGQLCAEMAERYVRIGATLALVVVMRGAVRQYNIGDSRIYALSGGALRQISEEHTLAAQKVRMGVLTPEQAETDRDRHKLTQYLGIFEDEMTIIAEPRPPIPAPVRMLLCSDGLTDMLPDGRIEEILNSAAIGDAANLLVSEALENGGADNVTCVVIDIPDAEGAEKRDDRRKPWWRIGKRQHNDRH